MKRQSVALGIAAAACAMALSLGALAGCGQPAASSSVATTKAANKASEVQKEEESPTGIANPWQTAETAEEAAKGAGLKSLGVPSVVHANGAEYTSPQYFYTSDVAQVTYAHGPSNVVLRKSARVSGKENFAGDYNDYAKIWTQDVDGIEVTCYGAEQGAAQLVLWQHDGNNYALEFSYAGDTAPALTANDVAALVGSVA